MKDVCEALCRRRKKKARLHQFINENSSSENVNPEKSGRLIPNPKICSFKSTRNMEDACNHSETDTSEVK